MEIADDDDDVEEEEEVLVYADFEEGTVDRDIFQNSDLKFKVIGLDSETPIVQLGEQTFKGSWNDVIGTKVFFEEDPSPEQVDPVFTVPPPKMLKYKCMSTKTLELSRIFLKPKNAEESKESDAASGDGKSNSNEADIEISEVAESSITSDSRINEVMSGIVAEVVMQVEE